jgi:hypothetical protein
MFGWFRRGNAADKPADKAEEQVQKDLEKLAQAGETQNLGESQSPAESFDAGDSESPAASPCAASPTGPGQGEWVVSESEKFQLLALKAKLPSELTPTKSLDVSFDWTLIRCLRARKGDVDAAIELLSKIVEWRKENNIDAMLGTADPNEHVFGCVCPHCHHGFDREGHPVYFEGTGKIRVGEVLNHVTEDDVVMRHVRFMEQTSQILIAQSQALGRYTGKVVLIHDLAGMKYTIETAGMRIFRRTTHIDQSYYPECLHRMLIINAPLSFRGVWAVIKPWLDPKTRSKVEIFGANYHARLSELIPPEHLPTIYGGLCTCEGRNPNGDPCLNPVRPVSATAPDLPLAWPKITRGPTDLEGGDILSPLSSTA